MRKLENFLVEKKLRVENFADVQNSSWKSSFLFWIFVYISTVGSDILWYVPRNLSHLKNCWGPRSEPPHIFEASPKIKCPGFDGFELIWGSEPIECWFPNLVIEIEITWEKIVTLNSHPFRCIRSHSHVNVFERASSYFSYASEFLKKY